MNILYDRDHYKLALGQLHAAKHLIDNVAKEYLKLLKFGDSLYRCKQLKRAALGRMATIMRRQKESLAYLEQVRQHLARLPSIDAHGRTLLLCGYPNVGKSSFMNKLTRAEVDVQPYAFTTKSLFVGHMDYAYLRWQVIDTPGILDQPLEARNTIEMQSITALAHLRAAVLYFVDVSGQCGYSVAQQTALFTSLRPLFQDKPIFVVANKADVLRLAQLPSDERLLMDALLADPAVTLIETSTLSEEGVMEARNAACEALLALRVEAKRTANAGRGVDSILHRLHATQPKARDDKPRPPCIPLAIQARIESHGNAHGASHLSAEPLEVQREQLAMATEGCFSVDLKKHYLLEKPEWRYDVIPEILDGKNIADFVDPDIVAKLAALEEEEEERELRGEYARDSRYADSDEEQVARIDRDLQAQRALVVKMNSLKKSRSAVPIKMLQLKNKNKKNLKKRLLKIAGPEFDSDNEAKPDVVMSDVSLSNVALSAPSSSFVPDHKTLSSIKERMSERSLSRVRARAGKGFSKDLQLQRSKKLALASQKKRNMFGKAGDADRHQTASLPRHLFSGKRKNGTHDRR